MSTEADKHAGTAGITYYHELFEITETHQLGKVPGVLNYPGRVLGATNRDDAIILPSALKGDWDAIQSHYSAIGLHPTQDVIWDGGYEDLRNLPRDKFSVFMYGDRAHAVNPDARRLNAVKMANSKNRLMQLCAALEVSTPATRCFDTAEQLRHEEVAFPVFLKADVSASGMGVYRCEDASELGRCLSEMGARPFQLQQEISGDRVTFLNVQFWGNPSGYPEIVETTEQVLDGCVHIGNRCPTKFSPMDSVKKLAHHLVVDGLVDIFAFDVAAVENKDSVSFQVLECNPRWNGASYPTMIAQKLDIQNSWSSRYLKPTMPSLADIRLNGLAFNKKRGSGVIFVNWGCVASGKLGVMVVGNDYEQNLAYKELSRVI